jgi:hypothetical protein
MPLAILLVLVVLLAGCMGDATLWVEGRIVSPQGIVGDACRLELHYSGDDDWADFSSVGEHYREEFVVAPSRQRYYLVALCPGGTGRSPDFEFSPPRSPTVSVPDIVIGRPLSEAKD